jgi:hypothetical protein
VRTDGDAGAPDRVRLAPLLFLLVAGCAQPPAAPKAPVAPAAATTFEPASAWAVETRSPWPAEGHDARRDALTSACGRADGALARVAARIVVARDAAERDPDRASALLRAEGEPHVRPRVVFAHARASGGDDALLATLASSRTPSTRCGVAIAPSGDRVAAVLVDALGDLDPLPTRARTGQWLTLAAHVYVPISGARVVLLGPRGLPRTVPTTVDRGVVRARFALDRPGGFLVQLVGDRETGPEPLLEARVFADVDPPRTPDEATAVPGEESTPSDGGAAHLDAMIGALRAAERASALMRDPRLDELARSHAEAIRRARHVAHDLGDGDLARRFEAAGLVARSVGENVAHARSVVLAHRALYASPSHRLNLLGPFTHVGVGVARDDAGDVWVCEVFADGLR